MNIVVLDASVIVKWVMPQKGDENDVEQALALLENFKTQGREIWQPPHWLAEVGAVLTRLVPETASADIRDLYEMEFPVVETPEIFQHASELSRTLDHHLFDTLYHAAAFHFGDAVLVTADERYYMKAKGQGRIVLLKDFRVV